MCIEEGLGPLQQTSPRGTGQAVVKSTENKKVVELPTNLRLMLPADAAQTKNIPESPGAENIRQLEKLLHENLPELGRGATGGAESSSAVICEDAFDLKILSRHASHESAVAKRDQAQRKHEPAPADDTESEESWLSSLRSGEEEVVGTEVECLSNSMVLNEEAADAAEALRRRKLNNAKKTKKSSFMCCFRPSTECDDGLTTSRSKESSCYNIAEAEATPTKPLALVVPAVRANTLAAT